MQPAPALSKLLRHRSSDQVLDEAIAMTFPASDPISIDLAYSRGKAAEALPTPDEVLDSGGDLSFPASDPISVEVSYTRAERIEQARAKSHKARVRKRATRRR